jgi:hypothetical protein
MMVVFVGMISVFIWLNTPRVLQKWNLESEVQRLLSLASEMWHYDSLFVLSTIDLRNRTIVGNNPIILNNCRSVRGPVLLICGDKNMEMTIYSHECGLAAIDDSYREMAISSKEFESAYHKPISTKINTRMNFGSVGTLLVIRMSTSFLGVIECPEDESPCYYFQPKDCPVKVDSSCDVFQV